MRFYPKSLRQKLLLSYIIWIVLILAFIFLSFNNLNSLQRMVEAGEIVSELFDTTLEIRRFEKNFFLYRTDEDYQRLSRYIDDANSLLMNDDLLVFTGSEVITKLRGDLNDYVQLLMEYRAVAVVEESSDLESMIRDKGKNIVDEAESLTRDKNTIKREALEAAKRNLFIGIGILVFAAIAGGLAFYYKAIKSLSPLEAHMNRIAAGEFSLINTQFRDRELTSLKTAFNKMLVELDERQQHLIQSEKLASLGTLVFGVAHELNNPLSNISTSSQILLEEIDGDDLEHKKELLLQIQAETDRARDVVGSVLEFSRSSESQDFNLKKAVDETIRLMKAEIPAPIRIITGVPDDINLYGDKQKIQQLLINLLQNAIDAIQQKGVIYISANIIKENGGRVELVVRDNGAGIDPEALSHIFDPFYSSKKHGKGYGLGLFIVHNIVEEQGGSISVDSYPGQGTVFTIVFPTGES